MWTDEHYGQISKYAISGLTLNLLAWRFSYGAEYESEPNFVAVDLQPATITFTQGAAEKRAKLYVVPASLSPDRYYLSEWSTDATQFETENPPTVRWTDDVACIHCLEITIPAAGSGNAIIVKPNNIDLPDPPDPRRDVVSGGWRIKAFVGGAQTAGYERLDAVKHQEAFPVSLGQLEAGESWFAKGEL